MDLYKAVRLWCFDKGLQSESTRPVLRGPDPTYREGLDDSVVRKGLDDSVVRKGLDDSVAHNWEVLCSVFLRFREIQTKSAAFGAEIKKKIGHLGPGHHKLHRTGNTQF